MKPHVQPHVHMGDGLGGPPRSVEVRLARSTRLKEPTCAMSSSSVKRASEETPNKELEVHASTASPA